MTGQMNREAMQALVDRLLDRPAHNFDMGNWTGVTEEAYEDLYDEDGALIVDPDDLRVSLCQTTACLSGDAVTNHLIAQGANPVKLWHELLVARNGYDVAEIFERYDPDLPGDWSTAGREILGLPACPGYSGDIPLFFMDRWPDYYMYLSYDAVGQLNAAIVLLIDMLNGEVRCDEPQYEGDPNSEWWLQFGAVWDGVSQ